MKTVEEIVGKVLGVDPKTITDKSGPADIDSWDSFNGLILATELENNFNVKFTIDEVVGVESVADIKKALKNHDIKYE